MLKTVVAASVLLVATGATAFAQQGATTGMAGGAVTGAIVGGPVGAAVGGVAGAIVGGALEPPPAEVRTYVVEQSAPSVRVEREIVVGEPIPEVVEYHVIPDNDRYAYAVVNDRRVILDPKTRVVIEVIE